MLFVRVAGRDLSARCELSGLSLNSLFARVASTISDRVTDLTHRHRNGMLQVTPGNGARSSCLFLPRVDFDWLRNRAGGRPNSRLKARLKDGSDS